MPLYPHVVINDSKGEFGGKRGMPGAHLVTSLKEMASSRSPLIQVRLPIKQQTEETWDTLYQWVFDRTNTMVITDELSMVMDGYQVPDGFRACACQGRSRKIGMINGCQRPASIPVVARSEAQKYICFELALRDDRKAVGEFMTQEVVDAPARGHNFYFFDKGERQLHYLCLNPALVQGG